MPSISQALVQTNNEYSAALAKQKGTGSEMDKQSFLLLLVTQFKYQDPLNPMEDTEFVSQLAQYSSLEQLMNLNTGMETLTAATNNQEMLNATSYIGKQVSVTGNTIGKTTDGATGEISVSAFRYAFDGNVSKGVLTVKDSSGNPVYTEDLSGKAAGTAFEFNWNGLTSTGELAPDGVYTVSLAAYDSKGEAVLSAQEVDARVTGVAKQDDIVYLTLDGGQSVKLANVKLVSEIKLTNAPVSANGSTASNSSASGSNSASNTGGSASESSGSGGNSASNTGDAASESSGSGGNYANG